MKKFIYSFIFILTMLGSCTTDLITIEEHKWFLLEIEGDSDIVVLNKKRPYIELNLESSKIGGNASCNNFFTSYSIEGESILIGEIAVTKMFCPDDTKQEYRFLQALRRTESYKITDDRLFFYEGDNLLLTFYTEK